MKEPFISHMFPNNYMEPHEKDYLPRTEDITIYRYYEKYYYDGDEPYCEYCDKELIYNSDTDDYEDCDCEDAKDEKSAFPKLSQITLQSIIDMLPEGVDPDDVKISLNLDMGGMGINGYEVAFSYEKTFEADPEGFKAAQKQYEENYQSYLVERQKYDEWKRQEEIKEFEKQIERLKNFRK